ncbi:cyclin [Candidiatus Paracoxiella cheracis]|uniref:cyclin n=1 Tax=Candidiatus Paracoxiella cheracis TaxID=3405120 RepID=UPI003BF55F0C
MTARKDFLQSLTLGKKSEPTAEYAPSLRSPWRASFESPKIPRIPIKTVILHLNNHLKLSFPHMVHATIYISRLLSMSDQTQSPIYLHRLTCDRLLIVSLALAMEHLDGQYLENLDLAKISDITTEELNTLKSKSLGLLGNNLNVSSKEYEQQVRCILSRLIKFDFFKPFLKTSSDEKIIPKTTTKNTL